MDDFTLDVDIDDSLGEDPRAADALWTQASGPGRVSSSTSQHLRAQNSYHQQPHTHSRLCHNPCRVRHPSQHSEVTNAPGETHPLRRGSKMLRLASRNQAVMPVYRRSSSSSNNNNNNNINNNSNCCYSKSNNSNSSSSSSSGSSSSSSIKRNPLWIVRNVAQSLLVANVQPSCAMRRPIHPTRVDARGIARAAKSESVSCNDGYGGCGAPGGGRHRQLWVR